MSRMSRSVERCLLLIVVAGLVWVLYANYVSTQARVGRIHFTSVIEQSKHENDTYIFGRTTDGATTLLTTVIHCDKHHRCYQNVPVAQAVVAVGSLGGFGGIGIPAWKNTELKKFLEAATTRCSAAVYPKDDDAPFEGTLLCVGNGSRPLLFYRNIDVN